MFKSFFNTTLLCFILIIIISIFLPIFSSSTITLSEEYYSTYDIDFLSVSSSVFRFFLAITY